MKYTIDELELQRCVDGELTDHERSELLTRLHQQGSTESWKNLALSFIEHQVFSKVFSEDAGADELKSFQLARPASPMIETSRQTYAAPHWMHRQVRPWFSIAASLLVGMIVGVGGHFMMDTENDSNQNLTVLDPRLPPQLSKAESWLPAGPVGLTRHLPQTAQPPAMNVHLTGMENQSERAVPVPVYSLEQWQSIQNQQMQSRATTAVPESVLQSLGSQGMTVDHQRHWYRAKLNDGREILIPTETMRIRHSIQ